LVIGRRQASALQREHRSAGLPADELASTQESHWTSSSHRGTTVGGDNAERTLGYRSVPLWAGRDGWQTLALVIDCHTRELLGWQLSRSGRATTATAALEQALIARFGSLGRVDRSFLLRSDNGLVFTSSTYTRMVRSYGLRQEFITPHCPQQNGMIERVIRTLKEQCVHRHRFETQQNASRVIGEWIRFYNTRRPHQALGMKTRASAYALAA
jgi:putative transposase